MENLSDKEKYKKAKMRVKELKGFYWHLAIFIIINGYIFIQVYYDKGERFWQYTTFITFFFWGIGVLIHGWTVLWKDYFFTKEWEQREIERFMKKESEEQKRWE